MAYTEQDFNRFEEQVTRAREDTSFLKSEEFQKTLTQILRGLEAGELRICHPKGAHPGVGAVEMTGDLRQWEVCEWLKYSILLGFKSRENLPLGGGAAKHQAKVPGRTHSSHLTFFDKFDTRSDFAERGIRVVPPGVVREGAHVAPGVVMMPGYVNVGAYVSTGGMVDTWATVGSCAQVGKGVHIAGGVGIGGVLEPAGARPVIIGDQAFLGSRAIIVEGAVISAGAVIGANVCVTASTPIYDVTTSDKTEYRGYVPENAVVVPGTRPRKFPGGEVQLQCAYIIAWRNASTDSKVSLNDVLRETGITV